MIMEKISAAAIHPVTPDPSPEAVELLHYIYEFSDILVLLQTHAHQPALRAAPRVHPPGGDSENHQPLSGRHRAGFWLQRGGHLGRD